MFRTMSQFILRDSIIYYTSYLRKVLIKTYKLCSTKHNHYIILILFYNLNILALKCFNIIFSVQNSTQLTTFYLPNLYILMSTVRRFFFPMARQPLVCLDLLIIESSRSHTQTHHTR